jgi:hypothetical protein
MLFPEMVIPFKYTPHGIYEERVVKPVWCRFVEQKFFCNILVTFGVGRSALSADDGQWFGDVAFCATSSEPEAEGDSPHPPATDSSSWADVALRSSIYPGSFPMGSPN